MKNTLTLLISTTYRGCFHSIASHLILRFRVIKRCLFYENRTCKYQNGGDTNVQIDRFDLINCRQTLLFAKDTTARLETFFNVTTTNIVQAEKVAIIKANLQKKKLLQHLRSELSIVSEKKQEEAFLKRYSSQLDFLS